MVSPLQNGQTQLANGAAVTMVAHWKRQFHLLNQFELDDIIIFEKNKENESIIKRVTEDDFPDWEGEYLPGQMWMNGQIGAKRW